MLQPKFDFTLSLKRQPLRSVSIRLPKLFQYTFAYRATELVKDFPEHVVIAWMGHSNRIAQKHYLQVTEDDYKQASSNPTQNPTQQITVSPRRGSQPILSAHEKTLVLQGLAIIRETLQTREVGDEGLEPPTSSV